MFPEVPQRSVFLLSSVDMLRTAFKKIVNIFKLPSNQTSMNTRASTPCFQDIPVGEQEKDNLGAYLRELQARAQVISAKKLEEEHYSYLKSNDTMGSSPSTFDYTAHGNVTSGFDDYDGEEEAGDEPYFSTTDPIIFSEDPMARSNEMLEFANDLVDIAVANITESEEIMNDSQIEDLSRWKERLDQASEMLEILDTDTPTERLLKARTYLMAAGELLKRVIFVVELAKSDLAGAAGHSVYSTQLGIPGQWQASTSLIKVATLQPGLEAQVGRY